MALVRMTSLPDPSVADLGDFPNALGWTVLGPQGKAVGEVVDMYVHEDLGGVASLAVRPLGGVQTFDVPVAEVEADWQERQIKMHRNLGEYAEGAPRAHDRPFLLRTFLEDHGVDEEAIDVVEAAGILTLEKLRAVVQRGGLAPLFGPSRREQARKVERVIREQRL